MINFVEKEELYLKLKDMFINDNLIIMKLMNLELLNGKMEIVIQVICSMVKCTEKENIDIIMEWFMKENIIMESKKEMEKFIIQKV